MIRYLVEQFPESHVARNANGSIPRHLAVLREKPALEVIRYLLELQLESVHVANNIGSLPLHAAIGRFESLDSAYTNRQVRVVKMLVDAGPDSGKGRGLGRTLPSSCGCDVRCTPGGILLLLLNKWPESIRETFARPKRRL